MAQFFPFFCSVQECVDEGNTYQEGAIWRKNCDRTTCECRSGDARCTTAECGFLVCLPGSRPGNPDPCGCNTQCVGECGCNRQCVGEWDKIGKKMTGRNQISCLGNSVATENALFGYVLLGEGFTWLIYRSFLSHTQQSPPPPGVRCYSRILWASATGNQCEVKSHYPNAFQDNRKSLRFMFSRRFKHRALLFSDTIRFNSGTEESACARVREREREREICGGVGWWEERNTWVNRNGKPNPCHHPGWSSRWRTTSYRVGLRAQANFSAQTFQACAQSPRCSLGSVSCSCDAASRTALRKRALPGASSPLS